MQTSNFNLDNESDAEFNLGNYQFINNMPDNNDSVQNNFHRRRPNKPGIIIATSKLMGKTKLRNNKRIRSMSPLWITPPGKTTKGSKPHFHPSRINNEIITDQNENSETKIGELLREVSDLRVQLNREKIKDEMQRSCETLLAQEDKIEHLKQGIDLVEKENIILRQTIDKSHFQATCDDSADVIQTLIETELTVSRCSHQMQHVFDNLKNILKEGHKITTRDIDRINVYFHDTESRLFEFKSVGNELRNLLKVSQHQYLIAREAIELDHRSLQQRWMELEELSDKLQISLNEKDITINDLRRQLARKNDEIINFGSTQESLENVKAHLQQQLKQKSGDCNRLAVQVRSLEIQITKDRLEKEHLMNVLKNPKDCREDDRETLKKATRAQKQRAQKAEKTICELSSLLDEKDNQLQNLRFNIGEVQEQFENHNKVTDKIQLEEDPISNSDNGNVIISSKHENDNLRLTVNQYETRLKEREKEIESLRLNLGKEDRRDSNKTDDMSQFFGKLEASERANQLSQLRITELEKKIKAFENKNSDFTNAVQENEDNVLDHRRKSDYLVRENASLMRQLETALTDSRINSDNSREKIPSKDRTVQSRIHDLESQLSQQRTESIKWQRSCDENERKYNDKLKDVQIQLEQSETTSGRLKAYVQFLKKSYANVFGDMPMSNGLNNPTSLQFGSSICF